jgi:hypothetical protein
VRASARAHLDHIVVGIRALDEGMAAFERLTGVAPVRGGRHPNRGTENALVSLGPGRYLEIVAPHGEPVAAHDLGEMRSLDELTVIDWAVGVNGMTAARQAMTAAGATLGSEAPGSRVLPSGFLLEWSTARLTAPAIATAPFFIQWKTGTVHPSMTSPSGCRVSGMEVQDPAAADLSRTLNALQISGVTVRRGDPGIFVTLECGERSLTLQSGLKIGNA